MLVPDLVEKVECLQMMDLIEKEVIEKKEPPLMMTDLGECHLVEKEGWLVGLLMAVNVASPPLIFSQASYFGSNRL